MMQFGFTWLLKKRSFLWASISLLSSVVCFSNGLRAQSESAGSELGSVPYEQVYAQAQQRLNDALSELGEVRETIAEKRRPVSTEISRLQKEVAQLRRERERLNRQAQTRESNSAAAQQQVEALRSSVEFVEDRLEEFLGVFENRINTSENARIGPVIAAARTAPSNSSLTPEQVMQQRFAVVELAMQRLADSVGGHRFSGKASNAEGELVEGTFVGLGPSFYFVSNDGQLFGLVEREGNRDDASVYVLPGGQGEGLISLVNDGAGSAPLDVTGGKAILRVKASKGLFEYVDDGGEIGYVIIALGLLGLVLSAFKVIEIVRFASARPSDVESVINSLKEGDVKAAQSRASEVNGIAGEMLQTAVTYRSETRNTFEEILFEKVLKARPNLERYLPFLAITAAAAPLLGLLGTVVGMIKTFNLITLFGTGDARSLSSGISEALVTTALGLIVAIPVLLLHGSLSRMAKRKLSLLEQSAVSFANGLFANKAEEEKAA